MSKKHEHSKTFYFIPGTIVAIFAVCVGFYIGYILGNILFGYTGRPSEFWAYMISGMLGICVWAISIRLLLFILNKTGRINSRNHVIKETLEALNRIAKGDFSVSLTIKEHDPFTELNKSVNKMASELASMESLRQDFISNVSHEIQSPLTSISGFAALLKSDSITDDQRKHYIEVIETESKRLSKLSDNLLKLSALESASTPLSPTSFRLDKQIEQAILLLEPQWTKKNIEMEANLEKATILADSDLLSQVWINLIHNAIKFTPQSGKISVSLTQYNEQIICQIADNGSGIPAEDQIHIFERFYKADKSRLRSLGGNGLGLSLCKKIVELHDGQITFESELNKGTTFKVNLPNKIQAV